MPIVLVGTKLDLRTNDVMLERLRARRETPVTHDEGKQLAAELGAAEYVEVSALTQQGINEVFVRAVEVGLNPPTTKKSHSKSKRDAACSVL